MLLARLIDPGDPVETDFNRSENGSQERPLTLKDSRHETAEGNDEGGEDREIDRDLNPAVECHGEPLRTSQA